MCSVISESLLRDVVGGKNKINDRLKLAISHQRSLLSDPLVKQRIYSALQGMCSILTFGFFVFGLSVGVFYASLKILRRMTEARRARRQLEEENGDALRARERSTEDAPVTSAKRTEISFEANTSCPTIEGSDLPIFSIDSTTDTVHFYGMPLNVTIPGSSGRLISTLVWLGRNTARPPHYFFVSKDGNFYCGHSVINYKFGNQRNIADVNIVDAAITDCPDGVYNVDPCNMGDAMVWGQDHPNGLYNLRIEDFMNSAMVWEYAVNKRADSQIVSGILFEDMEPVPVGHIANDT